MKPEVVTQRFSLIKNKLLIILLLAICSATTYFLLIRLGLLMPLSDLPALLCLDSCQSEQPVHPLTKSAPLLNAERSLPQILGNGVKRENISLLIEKSQYKLTLFHNLQPIKSYSVVFGDNPRGTKLSEGDRKTPEGIYRIRDLYPHPDWSKFMWLNYPTPQAWREHFQAKFAGKIAFNLPIGGEVGIHGVPNGSDTLIEQRSNWTLGCISLKNRDVNEIYEFAAIGTLVEIVP